MTTSMWSEEGRKPKPKRTCTRCGGEVRRADQEKCYGCREIETAELKAQRLAQRDRERERLASAEKAADDDRAHEPRWVRRGLVWYAVKPKLTITASVEIPTKETP